MLSSQLFPVLFEDGRIEIATDSPGKHSLWMVPAPESLHIGGKRIAGVRDGVFTRFEWETPAEAPVELKVHLIRPAGRARTVPLGAAGVAQAPDDHDFREAAAWEISVPPAAGRFLQIRYLGDVARLYSGSRLLTDNFYNGSAFEFGTWRGRRRFVSKSCLWGPTLQYFSRTGRASGRTDLLPSIESRCDETSRHRCTFQTPTLARFASQAQYVRGCCPRPPFHGTDNLGRTMPDARLEVRLFTGACALVGQSTIDRMPTQRLAALLGYLAVHPVWQSRARLAETIWTDMPEGKALASLRNALSTLRRLFESVGGTSPIEASRTHVRLDVSGCTCDLWELDKAISAKNYTLAVDLYTGDLLADLHDEWIEPTREAFRRRFVDALAVEAGAALTALKPDRALALATRWRQCKPFDPEAMRVYTLAQAGCGRVQVARTDLDTYVRDYRSEFGEDPEIDIPSLRTLIDSGTQSRLAAQPPPSSPPEHHLPLYLTRFFGREPELAAITEWVGRQSATADRDRDGRDRKDPIGHGGRALTRRRWASGLLCLARCCR